jgi:hypothetical protein
MSELKYLHLRIEKFSSSFRSKFVKIFSAAAVAISTFLLAFTVNSKKIDPDEGLAAFSAGNLTKHITVLASDEFEGRKPFTRAETKTINYLRDQFKAWGFNRAMARVIFRKCQWLV